MDDAIVVVGWDLERGFKCPLDCLTQVGEPLLIVTALVNMDFRY
jgi:hypothetical protein